LFTALQGRGLGKRVLEALLAEWDAAGGGALALGTQEPHAARLYERHGFTRLDAGAGGRRGRRTPAVPYESWVMVRPATAVSPPRPPPSVVESDIGYDEDI
jgi:ribosomal protein S18 acetylase RimI-like enzyme